jgi:hypothetical protein
VTELRGIPRIGILWRGDRAAALPRPRADRGLEPLYQALRRLPVSLEFVPYTEEAAEDVRQQLLTLDAVLVWVNPIQDGITRARLDQLLREVATQGVWVSSHPDVIARMGTKEVLYATRSLGWGSDTELYTSPVDFAQRFPSRLEEHGRLVLKQARGNGGNGVWKVALPDSRPGPVDSTTMVRVQDASTKDTSSQLLTLGTFMRRCGAYFAWSGSLVDQAFQDRLGEGLVRCYFSRATVVGFCHQWPKGLLGDEAHAQPHPVSSMEGPDAPAYQAIRSRAESDYVPNMLQTLGLCSKDLPAIWDADFLYGPKTPSGDDSYVLCEINVSAVWPFPPMASPTIAKAAFESAHLARSRRHSPRLGDNGPWL